MDMPKGGRTALKVVSSLLICGFCLYGDPASAKAARWTATSTTSMAITGNISVTANSIRFGNGSVIGLQPTGTPEVFTLYPPGANPVLKNGNLLCGEKPPTYVTIYRDGNSLALMFYDGVNIPGTPRSSLAMQPGMCASYFYER